MTANNGFNNKDNILIGIFFIMAWAAELIFLNDVGFIKYLLGIPVMFGAFSLITNTEIPIQAVKFWISFLMALAALVIILVIHSSSMYAIK
jgi:hypothetical protein